MSGFFELKMPRVRVILAAIAFGVAFNSCSHLTVAPKPVNAHVIAYDENAQNAGIIDCGKNGCEVTIGWVQRYKAMEKSVQNYIFADQNIVQEGDHFRVSYEVMNHFLELKRAERGGP